MEDSLDLNLTSINLYTRVAKPSFAGTLLNNFVDLFHK
jgi:hypothetical protein